MSLSVHLLRAPRALPQPVSRAPFKPVSARSFASRPRVTGGARAPHPPRGARTFATTSSLGFSLAGLFSFGGLKTALGTSESSSILREASPAAPTKQPYTLVFLSSSEWGVSHSVYVFSIIADTSWQSWIMYFREQGYDCIDMRVECPANPPPGKTKEELLSERTCTI